MLTRRRFLVAASSAALVTRLGAPAAAARFETPLPVPQLIDAAAGGDAVSLVVGAGSHDYLGGRAVRSFGYSAPVLGPALRLKRGRSTAITVKNELSRPTTVHWHGLIVPGDADGGPHGAIASGQARTVALDIDQPETTAWFHPHPHRETAEQVYAGLAGLILIEDGTAERVGLPRRYGVDDLPLVIQDRVFDGGGAPVYRPSPMDVMAGYRGETFIVNGVVAPVARVPAGLVRLRLLNGANARIFDLRFSDNRAFDVIASDGGYLPAPVRMQSLLMAPGERYEMLVDFSDGIAVVLETGDDRNMPAMGMMGNASAFAAGGSLMRFDVDRERTVTAATAPKSLVDVPALDRSKIVARRQFLLNDMMMGGMMGGMRGAGRFGPAMAINGRPFDMARIDLATRRGTLELWDIGSQMMMHPFHLHGTQFQIVSLNGRPPPPHQRGWKDTVLMGPSAQIVVPFTQPSTRDRPHMFHCHILEHEDAGMMGQFTCA